MTTHDRKPGLARRTLDFVETGITLALIAMMLIALVAATVELALLLVSELATDPVGLLGLEDMLEFFGFLLMLLIGLELLETIKTYVADHHIQVETIFLVAMIAVARKLIILDLKKVAPTAVFALAAIIAALAAGYFLIRKSGPTAVSSSTTDSAPNQIP